MTRRGWASGLLSVLVGVSCLPQARAAQDPISQNAIAQSVTTQGAATVRARQLFFGMDNVDPGTGEVRNDRVIFSWFSITSFAVALHGKVIFLDAYIHDLDRPGYSKATAQQLLDLRPEAIFIGHGHIDHAELAAYVAGNTGAAIVGSAELCEAMHKDAQIQFGDRDAIRCVEAVSRGSAPGAKKNSLALLEPVACVTAFKHVHSALVEKDPAYASLPITAASQPIDTRVEALWPRISTATAAPVKTAPAGPDGTVSVFYQFILGRAPHFTFAVNDTVGPLQESGRKVLELMRKLPKTDVYLGAYGTPNSVVNGYRDLVTYNLALQPKIYIPTHGPASTNRDSYGVAGYVERDIERQFDLMSVAPADRPEVRVLSDHFDYLRPIVFASDAKVWESKPAGRVAGRCPQS